MMGASTDEPTHGGVRAAIRFAFDYVDPGSYLASRILDRTLERAEARTEGRDRPTVIFHPLEIRMPPRPLVDPDDPGWREAAEAMAAEARAMGVPMEHPPIVPWSRKAHELALHAREKGCFREVHRSLFQSHFAERRDIGRVDVLVEIGARSGLDRTETKAVLDVDRYTGKLEEWRKEAERTRIAGVPTLLFEVDGVEEGRVEGFTRGHLEDLLKRIIHLSHR